MGNTPILLLPAALAVLTLTVALVALVVIRRRRRHAQMSTTLGWITDLQLPFETHVQRTASDVTGAATPSEPIHVRALRAQVRTLESALELEQQHVRATVRLEDTRTAEQLAAYRRQVELTVKAISRQVERDGSPELATARIAAAIDRLGAANDFSRPVLSTAGVSATSGRPEHAYLHSVAAPVEHAPSTTTSDAPYSETTDASRFEPVGTDLVDTAEADLAPAESEVVLPVPPVAESGQSRRSRRRFRGSAA